MAIKLLVGLGNPGPQYQATRHNLGADLVSQYVASHAQTLHVETKFKGFVAKLTVANGSCIAMIPMTYMNESGQAVLAIAHFYKIHPQEILIAHDELDLAVGVVRVKQGGGHGGHNGLRDVARALGTPDFHRIRIGIGHPGDKRQVTDYVLSRAPSGDQRLIGDAIITVLNEMPTLIAGDMQAVMRKLHSD